MQATDLWPDHRSEDDELPIVAALDKLGMGMVQFVTEGRGPGCRPLFVMIGGKTPNAPKRLLLKRDYKRISEGNPMNPTPRMTGSQPPRGGGSYRSWEPPRAPGTP